MAKEQFEKLGLCSTQVNGLVGEFQLVHGFFPSRNFGSKVRQGSRQARRVAPQAPLSLKLGFRQAKAVKPRPEVQAKNLRGSISGPVHVGARYPLSTSTQSACLELGGTQYSNMVGVIRRLNQLTAVSTLQLGD